ncbi:hypothetical protein ACLOJK_006034 [Asimina triloba]
MTAFYGHPKLEPEMIALIHHVLSSGVTFLDTADMYGPQTNELLLGKVTHPPPSLLAFFHLSLLPTKLNICQLICLSSLFKMALQGIWEPVAYAGPRMQMRHP